MGTRKLFGALLSVAMVAGSACGGSDSGGSAAGGGELSECPVDALDGVTEPVELEVWDIMSTLGRRTLEAEIEAFNSSQDKVKVVHQNQGVNFEEIQRKVEQAIPDKSLPGLVFLEDTKTEWVRDSGLFVSAQSCIDADPEGQEVYADLLPITRSSYSLDDQLWPAAFDVYTAVSFYNRAHFTEVGLDPDAPPTTLQELYEAAKVIKEKKPGIGFPVVLKAASWIFEWWLSGASVPIVNNGNGRDDIATESAFANDTTLETLELLKTMKDEGLLDVVPDTPGQADHVLAMALQQSTITLESTSAITTVAGVIEGTIDAERLKDELGIDLPAGSENLSLDLDIGAGPFPGIDEGGRGQIGGGVWYIPNTTPPEVQAAAWEFAKFRNSPENQAQWTVVGSNVPVFERVIEDPALKTDWETTLGGGWQKTAFEVLSQIDASFPGPVIGPYTETRDAIKKALEQVLLDGQPVGPAVDEADAQITSELESYAADVGR